MTLTRWESKGNILSMTFALPYFVLGVIVRLCLVVIADRRSSHKLSQLDWHELVAALQPPRYVRCLGGHRLSDPHRGQIDMEPKQIWESLGGFEGLKRMRQNAEIMLALAAYAQQWNFEEAVIVTSA